MNPGVIVLLFFLREYGMVLKLMLQYEYDVIPARPTDSKVTTTALKKGVNLSWHNLFWHDFECVRVSRVVTSCDCFLILFSLDCRIMAVPRNISNKPINHPIGCSDDRGIIRNRVSFAIGM